MQKIASVPVAGRKRSDSVTGVGVKSSHSQDMSDNFLISLQAVTKNVREIFTLLDATPFMEFLPEPKPVDALDILDKLVGVKSSLISDTFAPTNKSQNYTATAVGKLIRACNDRDPDDPPINKEAIIQISKTLERYSDPAILFLVSPFLIDLQQIKGARSHLKKLYEDSTHFAVDHLGKIAKKALFTHPDIVDFEKILSNPECYHSFKNLAVYTTMALEVAMSTLYDTMRESVQLLSLFCDLIEAIVCTVMPKLVNVAGIQFNDQVILAEIIKFKAWWKNSPYLPLKLSVSPNAVLLDPMVVLTNDDILKLPASILKQLNENADHLARIMEMHPTGISGEITPINQCFFSALTLHTLLISPVQKLVDLMGFQPGKLESTQKNGFAFSYQSFKQMYFTSYRVNTTTKGAPDRTPGPLSPKTVVSLRKSEGGTRPETERSEKNPARTSPPMSRSVRRPSDTTATLSSLQSLNMTFDSVRTPVKAETSPGLGRKVDASASPRLRDKRKTTLSRVSEDRVSSTSETESVEANSPSLLDGVGAFSSRTSQGEAREKGIRRVQSLQESDFKQRGTVAGIWDQPAAPAPAAKPTIPSVAVDTTSRFSLDFSKI